MLSKNKIKLISSLSEKKFRDETGFFVAEGTRLVTDLLPFFECTTLVATPGWLAEHKNFAANEIIETDEAGLKKISNQKTSQGVLAVFAKPVYQWNAGNLAGQLSLVLDDVQDPGNLGTIIRIADWFGIPDVFCSLHSADAFSPKTVQATMGALARVRVHYVALDEFLKEMAEQLPVYGTFMDGNDIYAAPLENNGIIVMGNEGNGISDRVSEHIANRLLIPNFPPGQATSESLNVGVATALVCAEFRRRQR